MTSQFQTFLTAAMRRPGVIGAVAPSSPGLADLLAAITPSTGSPTVVELGPGTGAVTAAIQRRLPATGSHVAVEIDQAMVRFLKSAHPGVEVVHGDAASLTDLGVKADAVVSGLPWALFQPARQRRILDQIAAVLRPDGAFTTFAYRHAGAMSGARSFHRLLHAVFDEVIVSHTVWRNMPASPDLRVQKAVSCAVA
ncbi:class I SAM-dependent methyltransferase [Kibdelosporangium philippinense]|nr:methyltransferase domain-containing protein [Kibdelosporangium philippinense]